MSRVPPFVDAPTLRAALPMDRAIDALQSFFATGASADVPQRASYATGAGNLLIMPAWGAAGAGVKLVTVTSARAERGEPLVAGVYVLFDRELTPRLLLDGAELTALRTAAVSGVATRLLARAGSARVMIFGTGVQAGAHLDAMHTVLDVTEVAIVGRTPDATDRFIEGLPDAGTAPVVAADASDVGEYDVICTCTTATSPLFDGLLVAGGTHVNAVGAHQPADREIDDVVVGRARIVVESRSAALAEAGDLLLPLGAGVIEESAIVADLAEAAAGTPVRLSSDDITLFKSVGIASEDLVLAAAVAEQVL